MHDFMQSLRVRRIRATWEMTTHAFTYWSRSGGHSYLRLSTYAINAFKSSGGRLTRGMPPAVILAVGCLNNSARCSGENFALIPTRAGATAVPTPPSPRNALQDCDSKVALPFAARGSAQARFAAARVAEDSSGS